MDHTGVTPSGAIVAPDLAKLFDEPPPFVTVELITESGIDNAAQRSEQHWKPLRRELVADGAPESALEGIDRLIPDAHLDGAHLAVVANSTGVSVVEHGAEAPPADRGRVGVIPSLVPLLAVRQAKVPYLGVLADRIGADIRVFRPGGPDLYEDVDGADYPLTKVHSGGWSQLRFQNRAENTWEKNADEVAQEVTRLAERFDARLVVVAGDVRAVELLRDGLSGPVRERVAVVDGGRSEDGSEDLFLQRAQEQLTAHVNAETMDLLGKFREELGETDRAADGPARTLRALTLAQVEVLLIATDPHDERTALCGPEPAQVGLDLADLEAMGVDDPQEAPLIDVAVRAALGTGAGVRLVPNGELPGGGLGAILRWS